MIANLDNSLTIRPATAADIASIYTIARQSLTLDVFTEELLREKLFYNPYPEKADYKVFLAEIDGKPVGFMQSVDSPIGAKGLARRVCCIAGLSAQRRGEQVAGSSQS